MSFLADLEVSVGRWWTLTGPTSGGTLPGVVPSIEVTPRSGMGLSTVFSCIDRVSETVATLPKHTYKEQENGSRQRLRTNIRRLMRRPNPEMTGRAFWQCLTAHKCGWGNGYAEIQLNEQTLEPIALWPLPPDRTRRFKIDDRHTAYRTVIDGKTVVLPRSRVLHIHGMGWDGLQGYSPISMARRSLEIALAADEVAARFMGSGGRNGIVLKHQKTLSPGAKERLRTEFEILNTGLSNAHRVILLEEGTGIEKITMPLADAQFVEVQKLSDVRICGLFNVPPHKIQNLERATFSNIESQQIQFGTDTIRPHVVAIEEEVNEHEAIWRAEEIGVYYFQFEMAGLMRGDAAARWTSYEKARRLGVVTANTVAKIEDYPEIPVDEGGDTFHVSADLVPMRSAGQKSLPPERKEEAP